MEQNQLDILSLILNAGVVVKLVIAILIGFSMYTWAIVFMKFLYHKKIIRNHQLLREEFNKTISIFDLGDDGINSTALGNKLLQSSILEIKKIEENSHKNGEQGRSLSYEIGNVERAIESSISECSFHIRKFNSTLASISSIAPFVGLFGTVWGIINSFQGLAGGGGSIQAVAPGIAEALVATAIGLAAAIPANWFFNKFTSEASVIEQGLVNFGRDIINLINRSI